MAGQQLCFAYIQTVLTFQLPNDANTKTADGINFYTKKNSRCHLAKISPSAPLLPSQLSSSPQTALNKVHAHPWAPEVIKKAHLQTGSWQELL